MCVCGSVRKDFKESISHLGFPTGQYKWKVSDNVKMDGFNESGVHFLS